jgi:WXG100 family type VII secretion target
MQKAGQHVLDVNSDVQGRLASLRGQLEPLAGAWKGEASLAFTRLMQRWDENARKLNEALRGIGESINTSTQTYVHQEEQERSSMSNIEAALEG